MRCCTTISALKMAKDMMTADPDINTVPIGAGYPTGDLVNLKKRLTTFAFSIGSGAGATLLRGNWPGNHVLSSHLMTDGSLGKHDIIPASGTVQFPTDDAVAKGLFHIDEALRKSGYTRADVGFLNMVLIKPSGYQDMLQCVGLTEEQSVCNADYGHIGERDSIINIIEGVKQGRLKDRDLMIIVAAGIGWVWGASCVKWGPCET